MSRFNLRGGVVVAVLALVGLSMNTATACDQPTYKKVVTYKTVEEQVVVKVPYQKKTVKYDHCGDPYIVVETCTKDVVQTVCKQVPVVTWVKVCN
jgi:hypothetical protein